MTLGVLVDPPVVDQPDRDRIEEVQLLPAGPAREDEARLFQQAQVLHDADARHVQLGFEFGQRAALTLEEQVEQEATGRVGQRLEHTVVVPPHADTIRNQISYLSSLWRNAVGPRLARGKQASKPAPAAYSCTAVIRPTF